MSAAAIFGILVAFAASAPAANEDRRYDAVATASVRAPAAAHTSDRFELRATPSVSGAASTQSDAAGRFVLAATAAASSLVCYSDTIFRNDFDADGF